MQQKRRQCKCLSFHRHLAHDRVNGGDEDDEYDDEHDEWTKSDESARPPL